MGVEMGSGLLSPGLGIQAGLLQELASVPRLRGEDMHREKGRDFSWTENCAEAESSSRCWEYVVQA